MTDKAMTAMAEVMCDKMERHLRITQEAFIRGAEHLIPDGVKGEPDKAAGFLHAVAESAAMDFVEMMKEERFDSLRSARLVQDWGIVRTYLKFVEQGRTFRTAGEVVECIIREELKKIQEVREEHGV